MDNALLQHARNLTLWLKRDDTFIESIAEWGFEVGSEEVQRVLIERLEAACNEAEGAQ